MERLPAVSLCRFGFEVVPDADVARALDAQVVDARRDDLALAGGQRRCPRPTHIGKRPWPPQHGAGSKNFGSF